MRSLMRRLLPALFASLAFALPTAAHAGVGLGTTLYLGPDFVPTGNLGLGFGGTTAWLPSFDLHFNNQMSLQIHALDTLAFVLDNGDIIFLGADLNFHWKEVVGTPSLRGVIEPGASLDLTSFNGDLGLVIGGQARIGMEGGNNMHVGFYIVPGLGLAAGAYQTELVWNGSFQLTFWGSELK